MKKVGIISMQRIRNYGSFMQAYGLKSMIEDLGHSVEFVDYTVEPCLVSDESARKNNKSLTEVLKKIYHLFIPVKKDEKMIDYEQKKEAFKTRYDGEFMELLGVGSEKKYRTAVDTLVIGSDEVFNCMQSNPDVGYSRELFGYNNNADKVITYAASFGNTTIEKISEYGKTQEIKELLGKIDTISVRDTNSGKIVHELLNKEPVYNLDPVLMYDFSKLIDCSKVKHRDYIIVYGYENRINDEEAAIIRKFADKNSKRLISISGYQWFCDEHLVLNPFEVLAYFKMADYIITDTFHGSIFSIINNKKFATIIRKSQGNSYGNEEKISDLLMRLGLTDRTLDNMENLENLLTKEIDYNTVNKIIAEQREITKQYLKEHI